MRPSEPDPFPLRVDVINGWPLSHASVYFFVGGGSKTITKLNGAMAGFPPALDPPLGLLMFSYLTAMSDWLLTRIIFIFKGFRYWRIDVRGNIFAMWRNLIYHYELTTAFVSNSLILTFVRRILRFRLANPWLNIGLYLIFDASIVHSFFVPNYAVVWSEKTKMWSFKK